MVSTHMNIAGRSTGTLREGPEAGSPNVSNVLLTKRVIPMYIA